jgi:hypothetical protein
MIWVLLLTVIAVAPVAGIGLIFAAMRAEAKPIVIIREDTGFGGDWK